MISYNNISNINFSRNYSNKYCDYTYSDKNDNKFDILSKKSEIINGREGRLKFMVSPEIRNVYKKMRAPKKLSKYIIKQKNDETEDDENSIKEKNVIVLPCSRYASRSNSKNHREGSCHNKNINEDDFYNNFNNGSVCNSSNSKNKNYRNYFYRMDQHRSSNPDNYMNYWYDNDNHSGGKVNLSLNNPCQKYKDNFYLSMFKIIKIQAVFRGFMLRNMLYPKTSKRKNIFYRNKYFIKILIDFIRNNIKKNFDDFITILRTLNKKIYGYDFYKHYSKFYIPEKVDNIKMKGIQKNSYSNFSDNKLVINRNLNKLSIIDINNDSANLNNKNRNFFINISPDKSNQFFISTNKKNNKNQINKMKNLNKLEMSSPINRYVDEDNDVGSKNVYDSNCNNKNNLNNTNSNIYNKKRQINKKIKIYSKKFKKSKTNNDISPSKNIIGSPCIYNTTNKKFESQESDNTSSQNQDYENYIQHIDSGGRYKKLSYKRIKKQNMKNEKNNKYVFFCFILFEKIKKSFILKNFDTFYQGLLMKKISNNINNKQKKLKKLIDNNTKRNLYHFFKIYKEQILTEKIYEKIYSNDQNIKYSGNRSRKQSINSVDKNSFSIIRNSHNSSFNNINFISENNNITTFKPKQSIKEIRKKKLTILIKKHDDITAKYFYKWKKTIFKLLKAKRHIKVKYFGDSKSKSKSKSKSINGRRSNSSKSNEKNNSKSPYKKMNVRKKYSDRNVDVLLCKKLLKILKMTDQVGLKNYFYAWKGKKIFGYDRKKFFIYFIMNIKEYFYSDLSVKGNKDYLLGKCMFLWYRKACH